MLALIPSVSLQSEKRRYHTRCAFCTQPGSSAEGTGPKRLCFLLSWRWKEANTPR